ncbi:2-dehydro-3-deoxygalactonokinase [Agarilytica rhodophyticola]|uniref:2-dehydro-3-deoxygalactonokinase n=1 Tax=Agarilytica rhodophyticola TaxID=1737490 RepID=UPI000B343C5E|nr:2-dehydro-3-deoxygalactonokinase [Agarilytica rhodophyticola]
MIIPKRVLAIDWGSSKFRAFLLDENYRVLESIETYEGVLHSQQTPRDIFYKHCQPWLSEYPDLIVLMSGSVGGNLGWINTHYIPCPLTIDDLVHQAVDVETPFNTTIKIIPGVSGKSPSGIHDVMRGEEVQIFGALSLINKSGGLVCLPGTHCKWVNTSANRIIDLTSFMSGELYQIACEKSSISNIINHSEFDQHSFLEGISTVDKQGGFLHHLFSARANSLVGSNQYKSVSSYVSGVIIGSEIKAALKIFDNFSHLILVCNKSLAVNYLCAFEHYGISAQNITSEEAFVAGVSAINPLKSFGYSNAS